VAADYAPISTFASEAPPASLCVVVSQRLSPNARVPLSRASAYQRVLLVTSVDDEDATARGVRVVKHGPCDEDGLFLRVIGPAAANATVIRLAGALLGTADGPVAGLREALATAGERATKAMHGIDPLALADIVGLVAIGPDTALCEGLRHKLLEALGRTHPPLWDLCALVHGPLQSFYERPATLVLFERETTPPDLTKRLASVLHPERHRVVRLRSALPGPFALLDFDLQLDHLVLAALRASPRDLAAWPAKGCDAPLYELGLT
jgi:hypothetical protein